MLLRPKRDFLRNSKFGNKYRNKYFNSKGLVMVFFMRVAGFIILINFFFACVVFKKTPEIQISQNILKEQSYANYSKVIIIKNAYSKNEEKIEDPDFWLNKLDYEAIAKEQGVVLVAESAKYQLQITIIDESNFNFTINDTFRSVPYYFWSMLSLVSLGVIPLKTSHNVVIQAIITNSSENKSLHFQENVIFDSWYSIVFALNGNYSTIASLSNEALEPAMADIFRKIKISLDQKKI